MRFASVPQGGPVGHSVAMLRYGCLALARLAFDPENQVRSGHSLGTLSSPSHLWLPLGCRSARPAEDPDSL